MSTNIQGSDFYPSERARNMAAELLPSDGEDTLPCIVLDGVAVFAYVQDGALVVSVHCDGDAAVWGDNVPVIVKVGNDDPVYQVDADGRETFGRQP